MAQILKGNEAAKKITEALIIDCEELKAEGIIPILAILRVGERADDLAYERGAEKRCAKIGIEVKKFILPADASQKDVLETIKEINEDEKIHGALLFRPFPKGMDDNLLRNALAIEKDIDGISDAALAGVFSGNESTFPPCTARACIEILKHYGYEIRGKKAVVIGRSLVIGKPVSMMLLKENATVTICHSKSEDMQEISINADILIAAVGRMEMINKNYLSKGQILVDVGINVDEDGNLKGDVKFDEANEILDAITPVPGGVGSVTTSVLAKHLIEAAKTKK